VQRLAQRAEAAQLLEDGGTDCPADAPPAS
jgi:hypothetical protein